METDTAKTSRRQSFNRLSSTQSGFTLLEIVIVVLLIGGLLVIGVRQFGKSNQQLRSLVRKVSVLSKEIHNAARMNNKVYRMVLRMDDKEGHAIWVESGAKSALLNRSQSEEIKEDSIRPDEETPPPAFSTDSSILRKPLEFPKPIKIVDVDIKGAEAVYNSGKAYIYYLPEGLAQEALIHLGDGKELNWTIFIQPITGQANVYMGLKTIDELRAE